MVTFHFDNAIIYSGGAMDILIIGGTRFLGRALVAAALSRGHRLALFNRGQSNPGLFPEVEYIQGDRDDDAALAGLSARRWEAVIDVCGYTPRVVRKSAEALERSVNHYTFISSISVYADFSQAGICEDAPVGRLPDESVEEITGETYGPLKALCEPAAEAVFPDRTLNIRPGLIVGPYDTSDRFTYWPVRVARGGEILAPGRPERPIQFIDVRDLAEWTVRTVEAGGTGVYNADGPSQGLSMLALLEACREVSGSQAGFTWVSEAFLTEQGVEPWVEMPLWVPESDPANAGFFAANVDKAIAAGLSFRSLAETVAATLAWALKRPSGHVWRAGLDAERELELLELWKK
jgi:2'-hydroxyisoflavone reductase